MKSDDKINDKSTLEINGVLFSHLDIVNVVHVFYRKVEQDDILRIPFRTVHDWPEHIKRLTHFWWVRFGGRPYMPAEYDPVTKHYFAGFNEELLTHWLKLFHQTLDEKLIPEQAILWKTISIQMGRGLSMRNEYLKKEYKNQTLEQED